jgi:hypothetical protein
MTKQELDEIRTRVSEYEDCLKNPAYYAVSRKDSNPRIKLDRYAYTDLCALIAETDRLNGAINMAINHQRTLQDAWSRDVAALTSRAEQAEAERDKAVKDLEQVDRSEPGGSMCKNHDKCYKWVREHGGDYPECDGCDQWEWRGLQEETAK